MFRHLLRVMVGVIVASGALWSLPSGARAQGLVGGGADVLSDPFSFYYGVYLPNQQLQSLRPRPIDTLNQAVAQRQYYSQMDRRSLYNPISLSDQTIDPLHPYSGQNQERLARPFRFAQDPSNLDGSGPSLYYGRAASFFPGLRTGRAPNSNVTGRGGSRALGTPRALQRGGGGGGGGGGMGGMGGGMGGMGGMM